MNKHTDFYDFRIRFNFPSRLCIESDISEMVISDQNETPVIKLVTTESDEQGEKRKSFNETGRAALVGGPYKSESAALEAGELWQSTLEVAFAYMGIAVDFGDRSPKGMFTQEGIEWLKQSIGTERNIVNDVHGLMAYESKLRPLFALSEAGFKVQIPAGQTLDIIKKASTMDLKTSSEEKIAYDLFSASFFQQASDARFLTLMMSVETLVTERRMKSSEAILLVDLCIEELKTSALKKSEKESLISGLKDLKYQSIGESCKQLAKVLDGNTYHSLDPETFIKRCYQLRSQLVHGKSPRPKRDDVDAMAAQLEKFMGNLLAYKLGELFRD